MSYFHWTSISFVLLMMAKTRCFAPSSGRYSKLNNCIGLVATHHFASNSTVAVLATDSYDDQHPTTLSTKLATAEDSLIQLLSERKQFSLVVIKPDQNNSYCLNELSGKKAVDYYVFAGSLHDVISCIESFCFNKLTHDHSNFLVYLELRTTNITNKVKDVLELFWKNEHQNVVVLADGQRGDINVYTWFPLEVTPQVEVVDQCNGTAFRKNIPLFPHKESHNLNGKTINVGLVVGAPVTCDRIGGGYAGPQITVMKSMAKTLNFTPVYKTPNNIRTKEEIEPDRLKQSIGPWRRILQGTLAGEVSVALGGFIMWPTLIGGFSYTHPIDQEEFRLFATNDLILTNRTEDWIWIMVIQMIGVQLITALAMHALAQGVDARKRDFASTALMIWSLLTESSTTLPKLSFRNVLLWTACAFYAININSVNRSVLTALLAKPIYVETIQTVTDMVKANVPVVITGSVDTDLDEMGFFSRDEISILQRQLLSCHDSFEHCLTKFISKPHFCWTATSGFKALLEVVLPNQKHHALSPLIARGYNTIYTKKNFFLARKMSTILLRAAQAGLLDYWYARFLRDYKVCDWSSTDWVLLRNADAKRPVSDDYSVKHLRPFSMTNVYALFHLLGYGLVIAMIVLVMEVLSAADEFRGMKRYFRSYFKAAPHKQHILLSRPKPK